MTLSADGDLISGEGQRAVAAEERHRTRPLCGRSLAGRVAAVVCELGWTTRTGAAARVFNTGAAARVFNTRTH